MLFQRLSIGVRDVRDHKMIGNQLAPKHQRRAHQWEARKSLRQTINGTTQLRAGLMPSALNDNLLRGDLGGSLAVQRKR